MELEEKIIHILENKAPIKAIKIAQELHETKTAINSKLYQMTKGGRCYKNQSNFWFAVPVQETNITPQSQPAHNSIHSETRTYSEDLPDEGYINNIEIKKIEGLNGFIAGYDPGGNNKNGFATLQIENGIPRSISIKTLNNAESVINEITKKQNQLIGLGVDTLSCWCSGNSGWRPADLWLKEKYPYVTSSIMSPNTLSGSMGINGMAVLIEIAKKFNDITLSETHPKVLYYALTQQKYNYLSNNNEMDQYLSDKLGIEFETQNDHEWDAVISAYALLMGIVGSWKYNLHKLPLIQGRIIKPCGNTFYYWPDVL